MFWDRCLANGLYTSVSFGERTVANLETLEVRAQSHGFGILELRLNHDVGFALAVFRGDCYSHTSA